MFKLRLAAAAAIACAVTLLSSGAQAYPDCAITLTLSDSTVVGGKSFDFSADAGEDNCDWRVTYRDKVKNGSGSSISGSYSTPVVSKKTTSKIVAECAQDDSPVSVTPSRDSAAVPAFYSTQSSRTVAAATPATCTVSVNVTLLPKGASVGDADDNGVLPNTGGSNLWILVLGGALVAGGAGVTYAARRRHSR